MMLLPFIELNTEVKAMSDFRKHLEESLKDEEFKKEWEKLEPKYKIIKKLIKLVADTSLYKSSLLTPHQAP